MVISQEDDADVCLVVNGRNKGYKTLKLYIALQLNMNYLASNEELKFQKSKCAKTCGSL